MNQRGREKRRKANQPQAVVREIDGQLVLDDPVALGVITAVNKYNCKTTLKANKDRVVHFKNRLRERGMSPTEAVIVIVNVDDPLGRPLADALMPGTDWQEFRDQGQVPFARGLAGRKGIQGILDELDHLAAAKLRKHKSLAVVVVDFGTFEVFHA